MYSIRKLSTAITLVALSLVIGVVSVRAAPETPQLGNTLLTPLLSGILNTVNAVGDDSFSTINLATADPPPTQHYGPYTSMSPDSGTCGNYWANDTFDRHFSVFFGSGSIVVVEQFKDGSFVTPATAFPLFGTPASPSPNPSPGACQNSAIPEGFVDNGVTGTLHGYFIIPLPAGTVQTSNDPHCTAFATGGGTNTDCSTTSFIDSHFTPCYGSGICSANTFFDHYTAPITSTPPNSGLIENEWKNASPNRGGNSGDIRSTNFP